MRPPAIQLFERLYLGSLALYLIGAALFWGRTQATIAAMPQLQANPAIGSFVIVIMVGTIVVIAAASLLFWWLVVRQRSAVGKWLVVVTEALGALSALATLVQLLRGLSLNPAGSALNLVATARLVGAAVALFRPGADAWFAEGERREPLA